jgi:DNA replication protein DnaC
MKLAGFPFIKTIDEFDFVFQRSITRKQVNQLLDMQWIEKCYNLIFLGPPGVGKSHMSVAIGYEAGSPSPRSRQKVKRLMASDLVIIDEIGFVPISRQEANLFFS